MEDEAKLRKAENTQGLSAPGGTSHTVTYQMPTAYELRAVGFLDVLGWREMIEDSQKNIDLIPKMGSALTLIKLTGELPKSIEDWLRSRAESEGKTFDPHEGRIQFAQFSDSLLISGEKDLFYSVLFQISSLIKSLFYNLGFLVRGAVTLGPMYHKGSVAFGPALTHGYDLERKSAIFPRVILDPILTTGLPVESDRLTPEPSPILSMLRRDEDGFWFFDYLQPLIVRNIGLEVEQPWLNQFVIPNLLYSKRFIEDGLSKFAESEKIVHKYCWLAKYFNLVNWEYPQAKVSDLLVKPDS
ncbi:MAG TPA: hypothetical protein VGK21_01925 [Candidatus Angelobacter sp.]|jgi:hypothetical protein